MRHKKESSSRSIDSLRFKLQKPISKDEQFSRKNNNLKAKSKKKRWWWKSAFFFLKWKKWGGGGLELESEPDVHRARARALRASISGSKYFPSEIPHLSLRELNMEQQQQQHRVSTSAMPKYLVT
ncbi:hypothetical protein V6N13_060836 [Hibiscus sabdariffa]|uniref:Uncharacterized protein n=1 Tax=Hibiscus sabdariffa TaxID=183260 RepID=A0ABR2P6M7_9ROSI